MNISEMSDSELVKFHRQLKNIDNEISMLNTKQNAIKVL